MHDFFSFKHVLSDLIIYGVFSHDVTAAILVSQNNETAAMLVSQTSPVGVELLSYANAFFWSKNQDFMWRGANEAKVDQTTEAKCIFYCLIRLFRKVAIPEKL